MQLTESAPAGAPILSEYLSREELAVELNVTPRTIDRWRRLREGPAITRIGHKVMFRRSAVTSWLASRETELA